MERRLRAAWIPAYAGRAVSPVSASGCVPGAPLGGRRVTGREPAADRGGEFMEGSAHRRRGRDGFEEDAPVGFRRDAAVERDAAAAVGDDCAGNGVGVGTRRAVGVGSALQATADTNASVAAAMARSGRGIAVALVGPIPVRSRGGAARHAGGARAGLPVAGNMDEPMHPAGLLVHLVGYAVELRGVARLVVPVDRVNDEVGQLQEPRVLGRSEVGYVAEERVPLLAAERVEGRRRAVFSQLGRMELRWDEGIRRDGCILQVAGLQFVEALSEKICIPLEHGESAHDEMAGVVRSGFVQVEDVHKKEPTAGTRLRVVREGTLSAHGAVYGMRAALVKPCQRRAMPPALNAVATIRYRKSALRARGAPSHPRAIPLPPRGTLAPR